MDSYSFLWPEGQAKTRQNYIGKEQLTASLEPTHRGSTGLLVLLGDINPACVLGLDSSHREESH